MVLTLEASHPAEYRAAAHLIEMGVPIFIAHPHEDFPSGGSAGGYVLPNGWQFTRPDPEVLGRWREGDALCAVMGHTVDGLDIDTNKGGSLGGLEPPRSYGRARTPSGGTHDLIAPLGARSRDGLLPGVDYKGGHSGAGHGFLFLAPTVKMSKASGEMARYEWVVEPDLWDLALDDDCSGAPLLEQIQSGRVVGADGRPSYDGPEFDDLTDAQRRSASQYVETELMDWSMRLGDATGWPEGHTDDRGRGWEALTRDFAWAIARIAVCPWTPLTEDQAQAQYESILPEAMASNPKCRGKWYEGILEKAAAQPATQPPWWIDAIFEQTPVLRHIQQAAHSGVCIPEGLLGVVLARVLAEVPPHVMLPPVGALRPASLNLGVAMVGRSGAGKSNTVLASRDVLGEIGLNQKWIEEGPGSGEGWIDAFLEEVIEVDAETGKVKKTGTYQTKEDPRHIFVIDEVDSMAAAADRSGSTLNPIMRSALSGQHLKTSNTRAGGRYRSVIEGTYRMTVLVGVQPMASGVLLSQHEESRGTPQRFLWATIAEKGAALPRPAPAWPGSLDWEPPEWPEGYIEYPDHIRQTIEDMRYQAVEEEIDGSEGHATVTRLKVAFALALLHGEVKISDQWWDIAGMLMARSREIQSKCKAALATERQQQVYRQVLGQRKAEIEVNEVVSQDRLGRAVQALVNRLQKDPGVEFNWTQVKPHSRILGKGAERLDTTEILSEAQVHGVVSRKDGNSLMVKLET